MRDWERRYGYNDLTKGYFDPSDSAQESHLWTTEEGDDEDRLDEVQVNAWVKLHAKHLYNNQFLPSLLRLLSPDFYTITGCPVILAWSAIISFRQGICLNRLDKLFLKHFFLSFFDNFHLSNLSKNHDGCINNFKVKYIPTWYSPPYNYGTSSGYVPTLKGLLYKPRIRSPSLTSGKKLNELENISPFWI